MMSNLSCAGQIEYLIKYNSYDSAYFYQILTSHHEI